MPSQHPTLFLALSPNLKPTASNASIAAEEYDESGRGNSLSDVEGAGSSPSTVSKTVNKVMIIVIATSILLIPVLVFCINAIRLCWQKWSGYTQIDLEGEPVEFAVLGDFFQNESVDSQHERTHLTTNLL